MNLSKVAASTLAAVIAVSGAGAILVSQGTPEDVEAVELESGREPSQPEAPAADDLAIRRSDDDTGALDAQEDDDPAPTSDGDSTRGDDGTSGGNNTGDGDSTRGDDGTSGGNSTGDGDSTNGNDGTSGGNNTGDGDSTNGNDGTSGGNNTGDGGDTGRRRHPRRRCTGGGTTPATATAPVATMAPAVATTPATATRRAATPTTDHPSRTTPGHDAQAFPAYDGPSPSRR